MKETEGQFILLRKFGEAAMRYLVFCLFSIFLAGCETTETASSSTVGGSSAATSAGQTSPLFRACTNRDTDVSGLEPLAGVYKGFWLDGAKNALESALVIRDFDGDEALVTYVHGTYAPWEINEPGCERDYATVKDGVRGSKTVTIKRQGNVVIIYNILSNGRVTGSFTSPKGITRGTFQKSS